MIRFALLVAVLLTLAVRPMAWGQDGGRKYMGVRECDGCHGGGAVQYPGLVNAWGIWSSEDPHSRAYSDLIEKPLSRHIAGWMGLPLDRPEEWKKCTVCHMTDVPKEVWGERFDPTTEGVGCEACHGPAEDYLVPHKSQSYEENLKVGLYDLKDLRTRAKLCLDCHTGLDHEIAAAGHPDLNFELFHFSFWQPPHWNYSEANPLKFWAIGQAAALEKTVSDLVRDSALYQPIPEFHDKSCYNCHHKIDQDRWRQVQAHQTVTVPLVKNLLGENRAQKLKQDLDAIRKWAIDDLPSNERTSSLRSLADRSTAGLVDEVHAALESREIDAALIRGLIEDLTQPIPASGDGLKPHLPVAWMVENFNDAEQIYLALYSLAYSARHLENAGQSSENIMNWLEESPTDGALTAALDRLFESVKFSRTANRKSQFQTEGFNQGLGEVRDAFDR